MAYAIDYLDRIIREELPSVMYESLPAIAPIYKDIPFTSDGVTSTDARIGRGWKVIHLFATGVGGLIQYANPSGPGMTTITGNMAGLMALGTAASNVNIFPNAEESPQTSELKRELVLHMLTGNFSIPVTWLQADKLTATQIKSVGRRIKAVGDLHAMVEAVSFFAATVPSSVGSYDVDVLGRITSIAENSSIADYIDVVINEEYGRIANFRPGMAVDIVAASTNSIVVGSTAGTAIRNYTYQNSHYVQLIIVAIDYIAKKITLAPVDTTSGDKPDYDDTPSSGDTYPKAAIVAGDWLVLRACSTYASGSRPMMSWGLEDWLKASGKLMGGASAAEALDLAYYPQFKSQVVAVSGPLTEDVMNRYIGGYLDAYPDQSLDTIITTQGVTQNYIVQASLYNNRFNYDRTGKALNIVGGWTNVAYSFNGRNMQWIISPLCLAKRLYALKLAGGNIKRYVPPRVGGTSADVSGEVEFLGPVTGHTGIFMPAVNGDGRPLAFIQAPFWQYKLIAPQDPRGVKLTNLTESIMT